MTVPEYVWDVSMLELMRGNDQNMKIYVKHNICQALAEHIQNNSEAQIKDMWTTQPTYLRNKFGIKQTRATIVN